ncbi:MAG: 1,4-alpha-glucan branching protein GlgB [Lachnospiraceae bacterium]|nr:1,4-alpha-glucan branching protein GlgB [Lachnospiraceae bacterium]
MDFQRFYGGREPYAYQFLGAHPEGHGYTFRVFAPSASRVSLIGEFNGWQEWDLYRIYDGNFWEIHDDDALPGQMYKYRVYTKNGSYTEHCDPYGFGMEKRPAFASILRDMSDYTFEDEEWMKTRTDCICGPLSIYEVHLGSFKKPSDEPDAWYTYEELIPYLIPYVKENGYNYLEFMPLNEYPSDESWGYQSTGLFSPTSRYGTATGLKKLVDACHQAGIGVIMDFVPVHFAVDSYALRQFDGTALYEYPNDAVGVSEWGSCNFMHSRPEVRSFLTSAANYWLTEYHIDGLRMDAISRIIYWQGNEGRGINHIAVDFLKSMNRILKELHPTALLAAEDSTSFPGVTKPVWEGGLGFDYKWDLGWMNDTLNYFRLDPEYRTDNYHKLTFSMMYFYNDRFLLPLSHDEVVHGKATIMQKMNGQYEDKFPQARALYLYMYGHPGKKLNFCGNELGQLREWDEKREPDWDILEYPIHDAFHRFMRDLNLTYQSHPAFYEKDYAPDGFMWLDCHQEARCLYAFERRGGGERLLFLFNFSDETQAKFPLAIDGATSLKLLMHSERDIYGGTLTLDEKEEVKPVRGVYSFTLPRYSAVCYQIKEVPHGSAHEASPCRIPDPASSQKNS